MTDERVYDGNTEERLTRQRNLRMQESENRPPYPHQDEPRETEGEHATEGVIGHEVRPIEDTPRILTKGPDPYARFSRSMDRPMPRHARTARFPAMTNAGRMENRPAPSVLPNISRIIRAPDMHTGMNFDVPRVSAPKDSRGDPFKGLSEPFGKSKPLPEGMKMFNVNGRKKQKSKKANRFIW